MSFFYKHPLKLLFGFFALILTVIQHLNSNEYDISFISLIFFKSVSIVYYIYALLVLQILDYLFYKRFIVTILFFFTLTLSFSIVLSYSVESKEINDSFLKILVHFMGLTAIAVLTTLAYFIRDRYINKLEYITFNKRKLDSEIKLLYQQLNPHFLFNTLNSIYAASLQQKQETPELIIQLSEMLRYELDIIHLDRIEIIREIEFIRNYIAFEKRRFNGDLILNFQEHIECIDLSIPPNILLTQIENCFKHSNKLNHYEIMIEITVNQSEIKLVTKNYTTQKDILKKNGGLKNLRERLEYNYPKHFNLNYYIKENYFYSELKFKL